MVLLFLTLLATDFKSLFPFFSLSLHLAGHSSYTEKFTITYFSFSFSTAAKAHLLAYISGRMPATSHNVLFVFYTFFSLPVVVRFSWF